MGRGWSRCWTRGGWLGRGGVARVCGPTVSFLAANGYSYPVSRRHRAHRPGRPPAFDAATSARRNGIERGVNRRKQFRAIATRYDKTADAFPTLLLRAAITL